MAEYAAQVYSKFDVQEITMRVNIDGKPHDIPKITKDNKMVLQKIEVSKLSMNVSVFLAWET